MIRQTIETAGSVVDTYLADLDDDALFVRPVTGMNHIAWQLGHVTASEHRFMTALGVSVPPLPPGFAAAHAADRAAAGDRRGFLSKADYLVLRAAVRRGTLAGLEAIAEARLADSAPDAFRAYAPTVADVFLMVGTHDMLHAGQFVAVRRLLGRPVRI